MGVSNLIGGVVLLLCGGVFAGTADKALPEELTFLTWPEYIDMAVVKAFEAQFNAKLRFVYFESDEDRTDLLVAAEARGFDLVTVNGNLAPVYARHGWLAPLSDAEIPNMKHLHVRWLEDYGRIGVYGVPYFWGTLGIAYRKDLVRTPITRWKQLYQPDDELKQRFSMIRDSSDLIGMGLKSLGYSANSTDPAAHQEVEALLLQQKPFIHSYDYPVLTQDSSLLTGEVVAAMMYNGDALLVMKQNPNVVFQVPEEGGNLWVDYLAVLSASPRKSLAMAFINFLNEPENAARNALFVHYATPNKAAEQHLPKAFLSEPLIYPDRDVISRSEIYRRLPIEIQKLRSSIFAHAIRE